VYFRFDIHYIKTKIYLTSSPNCHSVYSVFIEIHIRMYMSSQRILHTTYKKPCYYIDIQGVQLKTEPRHMASNGRTFPHITYIICSITYHILKEMLEMTSFNSRTCLTPGEQAIKSSFLQSADILCQQNSCCMTHTPPALLSHVQLP
jgi:hypothetical protein